MIVQFWGVRGSTPVSGRATSRTGGHTSCVTVETPEAWYVFDAGTGIADFGRTLQHDDRPIFLLLSHPHWDHIQGFPFFAPIWRQGHPVTVVVPGHADWAEMLINQIDGRHFPVDRQSIKANLQVVDHLRQEWPGKVSIRVAESHHPGSGQGYRLDSPDAALAYVTDNELRNIDPERRAQQVDLCRGVDLLIHDAQYRTSDFPGKSGWGHSTGLEALELAQEAHARMLAFFHHAPERTDDDLDDDEHGWTEAAHTLGIRCFAAREGDSLRLGGAPDDRGRS